MRVEKNSNPRLIEDDTKVLMVITRANVNDCYHSADWHEKSVHCCFKEVRCRRRELCNGM